jgi:Ca2+-binding RTX toxin-like protein
MILLIFFMINKIRAGASGDDRISAGNNKNVIVGHDGNDIINGYQGNIVRFKTLHVLGTSVTK